MTVTRRNSETRPAAVLAGGDGTALYLPNVWAGRGDGAVRVPTTTGGVRGTAAAAAARPAECASRCVLFGQEYTVTPAP